MVHRHRRGALHDGNHKMCKITSCNSLENNGGFWMFSQCPRKKVSILWPAFLHHSFGEVRICTLWMGVQAKCLANVVHLHGINQTTCFQKPGISDSIFLRKGSRRTHHSFPFHHVFHACNMERARLRRRGSNLAALD